MMNRLWQHHFGEGIVRTPCNFGKMGEKPLHPELLDWLASEFVDRGWSLKAMHKVMLESRAYQMASMDLPANIQICLLYTSDAADERSSVDLGGRRIIKK